MPVLLSEQEIEEALKQLNVAWSALPGQGLVRVFETGNFAKGLTLVGRITEVSEAQDHDPEAHITYDQVELTLTSRDAGGVTQKDIDLARAIDSLNLQS